MNKDKEQEKEGVVIDVTPEQEAAPTEPEQPQAPAEDMAPNSEPKSSGSVFGWLFGLVLLAIVLGGFAYGYLQLRSLQQELGQFDELNANLSHVSDDLNQAIEQTRKELATQQAEMNRQQQRVNEQSTLFDDQQERFKQQTERLADEKVLLDEREAELRGLVADLHRRVGRTSSGWMVAEAEYLIRLANHRLQLARDVGAASTALKLADQRLQATADPGWGGVREQLAHDQAALASLKLPDITGLSARLGALAGQTAQLHLDKGTLGGARGALPTPVMDRPEQERSWRTLLDDIWTSLKESVRLRRNDEPVQAMLPPEQQYFLVQNLRLQIEAARLALLRGEPALYRASLETAQHWLEQHFDLEDGPARALRAGLSDLGAIDIRPELPDISGSLRAMAARRALLQQLPETDSEPAAPSERESGEPAA